MEKGSNNRTGDMRRGRRDRKVGSIAWRGKGQHGGASRRKLRKCVHGGMNIGKINNKNYMMERGEGINDSRER